MNLALLSILISTAGTASCAEGNSVHRQGNTIARLIDEAETGAVVTVPPGVYHEHVRIRKSVVLTASGDVVIDGGGSGDVVEISAPGVELRGFTIRGTGIDLDKEHAAVRVLAPRAVIVGNTIEDALFGIDLRESPDSVIRENRIAGKPLDIARRGDGLRLWRADRAVIEGNTIHDGRDAILWYSTGVVVRNNTSVRCRYGFHLMYSDGVDLSGNEVRGNSVGIYVMYSAGVRMQGNRITGNRGPSGYGVGLKDVDGFAITGNLITGNRVGMYLDGSPFSAANPGTISRNTLACNDIGVTFLPAVRGAVLIENNFIDNTEQVCVLGRGQLTGNSFSAGGRGNYWSDYTGYDQDRDGVGDYVHEPSTLFENLLDKEPKLRLLLHSPVQQAVELVGKALPSTRPEPKFFDEYPLMRPSENAGGGLAAVSPPRGRAMTAGLLLGLGAGVLALASAPRLPRGKGAWS